jgi:NO-binding membrane sensor protein with MHYT domain
MTTNTGLVVDDSYPLVALSIFIATREAHTALDLACRVTPARHDHELARHRSGYTAIGPCVLAFHHAGTEAFHLRLPEKPVYRERAKEISAIFLRPVLASAQILGVQ